MFLFLCIKPLDLHEVAQSEVKRKGLQLQDEDCLGHGVSKTGSIWQPVVPHRGLTMWNTGSCLLSPQGANMLPILLC